MKNKNYAFVFIVSFLHHVAGYAAPDEDILGKARGYPIAPSLDQAFSEPYKVGSFSAMDVLSPHCSLEPSVQPQALPKASREPNFRYKFDGKSLSLDDYMQRQRVSALLVLKDGEIVAERKNYERKPEDRMLSNSMAKTIVALGFGKALEEGRIRSLNDTAAEYEPKLAGTLYGSTKIINLLRMSSGARFIEDYSNNDDLARFAQTVRKLGTAAGAAVVTERVAPEGTIFNYASAETQILGLVLRGATGQTLCQYIGEKLWQPLGAESRATWLTNPIDKVERAGGNFNATVHDYARLGSLLANDGVRNGQAVLSKDYLLQMTQASLQPPEFRPGTMQSKGSTYFGYGLQTWLFPGTHRRFALQGIHGQAIMVDPVLKLVVVHMAVGKDASGDASGMHLGAERDALFRGITAAYGNW
jgi:CubicO group peptidase (beta-lactamase class C family)